SLAVRSEVYAAVGGMPALPVREDVAFVERVCQAGYPLRHPLDVQVSVSARLDGRSAGGMPECLKSGVAAEEDGLPHLVDASSEMLFQMRPRRFYTTTASAVRLTAGERIVQRPNGRALESVPAGPL